MSFRVNPLTTPAMRRGKDAGDAAKLRVGAENRPGLCKQFVRESYGISSQSGSAAECWRETKHKRHPKDINDTPAYVPAYFDTGKNGHVVITIGKDSHGRRLCVSVDVQDSDHDGRREIGIVPLEKLNSWGPFQGYGLDFDGQMIVQVKSGPKHAAEKKSVHEIAEEVLNGKWGDGAERKKKLQQAGYSFSAIQHEVNILLKRR